MSGRLIAGCCAIGAAWAVSNAIGSDHGLVLAQPASEALARLSRADRVVEGTGMGSLTIAPDDTLGNTAIIKIHRAGDPHTVPCRVTVSAVSEASSRADVDCRQPGAGTSGAQEVATQAITLVMREHVRASVENRAYDIDGVANAMMMLVAANGAKLAGSMQGGPRQHEDAQ